MAEHRPPEGRHQKHSKPMIPGHGTPLRNPNELAKVGGMRVMRKPIFQSSTDRAQWQLDMLMAIHTAQQLGITQFEIKMEGEPLRPAPATPNAYTITYRTEGDGWRGDSSLAMCKITVYAHVVE